MPVLRAMRNPWVSALVPLVVFVAVFMGFLMLGGDSFGHALGYSLVLGIVLCLLSEWHGLRRRSRATGQP